MPLYLITGLPGSGKSTTYKELLARGYEAYDGDEDHLARWFSSATGLPVEFTDEMRSPEFVQTHSRDIARSVVEELAAKAKDKPVFLSADPENEDELRDLFAEIFALRIDDDTIKHRLATRTNSKWGKLPHEVAYTFAFKQRLLENCAKYGYTVIDSSQPPAEIVSQILAKIGV